MLIKYLRAAMENAAYDQMESGEWFGEIAGFSGLWAKAATREACALELEDALGDWLMISFRRGMPVPIVEAA